MMAREITNVDLLQQYIHGVMERAGHHAQEVSDIILAIIGAVVWQKDEDIQVFQQNGEMKNVLWVNIRGNRYALSYNHEVGAIEVRRGSISGETLRAFSNETPISEVKDFFSNL